MEIKGAPINITVTVAESLGVNGPLEPQCPINLTETLRICGFHRSQRIAHDTDAREDWRVAKLSDVIPQASLIQSFACIFF